MNNNHAMSAASPDPIAYHRSRAGALALFGICSLVGCASRENIHAPMDRGGPPSMPSQSVPRPNEVKPERRGAPPRQSPLSESSLTATRCFPLAEGNHWLYEVEDSKGARYYSEYQIERIEEIDGKKFYVSLNTMSNQPNLFTRLYLTHTPAGLSNHRIITTSGHKSAVVDYGSRSDLPVQLPTRLTSDTEWQSRVDAKVYATHTTETYHLRGRVEGEEVISAARVVTVTQWQGKSSTTTAWYAPGVGQIKFTNVTGDWRHTYSLRGARLGDRKYGSFSQNEVADTR